MKPLSRYFAALTVASLLIAPGAAQSNTLEAIKQRNKILVGVDISAPPYGMLDEQARQTGSDVEAARLLAKDLGVGLEIVPVNGPNRVPYLLSRKVDVVLASFSITDERKKVVAYSKPYGVVPILVAGPKSATVGSFEDLRGKTIAVTRGTTSDQELTRGLKNVPEAQIVRYEDDATTNTAVATGQQDFLVGAPSVLPAIKKANPARDIVPKFLAKAYPYAVGLRKNEPELNAWLDGWVEKNLQNGKFNEIYQRYFGMPLPAEMQR
ncbi:transporter substrate-binding domain-containing protein [Burkholderia multivorans]|uniref:transporter substrate-binding domain-containing protein n=1 Tax=Burkholderia multivorans TaxID=87883 RepID=UPI001C22AB38|nr:transporter substrate-binding domain-containing protein [Burkholderia multivorans]MBU9604752.1 transporter substrate-binding domain-containing protein [Burkholderia multivorans]MBU9622381.1 transporter substrate-binding domain-containing protein [Burkholderia multivorans]